MKEADATTKLERKAVQNIIKAFENAKYTNENEGRKVADVFLRVSLFLLLEHSATVKEWADTVSLDVMQIGDSMTDNGVDVVVEAESGTMH
jgi:hypothetical protein